VAAGLHHDDDIADQWGLLEDVLLAAVQIAAVWAEDVRLNHSPARHVDVLAPVV
jgi:hypothetical protein